MIDALYLKQLTLTAHYLVVLRCPLQLEQQCILIRTVKYTIKMKCEIYCIEIQRNLASEDRKFEAKHNGKINCPTIIFRKRNNSYSSKRGYFLT